MAFGDALRPVDGATVVLNVDTSQTSKLEAAEREWRESVGQMSKEALKLDLAQDRLTKSLGKYGAESAQAKRATIALRDAEEQAARAARGHDAALNRRRSLLSGMRGSVIGLAAAYVGVNGLVSGIRAVTSAFREAEVVEGQTKIGLEALGISYAQHEQKIQRVIRAISQLGFDDEELLQSFLKLVRGTKDVDLALERTALAAGVARGTFKDLSAGTDIVVKAQLGMSGALRRTGLDVEKNATRTELLTFLTEQFGKSAVKAAGDGSVAGERFAVEWENLKEILGSGVSPALADISTRLADYLGDAENQERIQRQVNEAVETGEDVVRGLAGAFRIAKQFADPFIDAVGGVENAVKLLGIAWLGWKAKAVAAFIVTAASSALTSRKMVADATVAGRAWDVATHPRMMPVTVVAAGKGGKGGVVPLPGGLAVTTAVVITQIPGASGAKEGERRAIRRAILDGEYADRFPRTTAVVRQAVGQGLDSLNSWQRSAFVIAWNATSEADLARAEKILKRGQQPTSGRSGVEEQTGQGPPPSGSTSPSGGKSKRTITDIELDIARAERTATTSDDLRFHRELLARYEAQIRNLEQRKNLTQRQKERLQQLYSLAASEQAEIDRIIAENERKLDEQRERAEEQRERERQRRRERERQRREAAWRRQMREFEDFERRTRERDLAYARRFPAAAGFGGAQAAAQMAARGGKRPGSTATGSTFTEADLLRMQFDFLSRLTGEIGQFGSNFSPDSGQTATNTYALVALMREQNYALSELVRGGWHGGAQYASAELSAAGYGVGF
jgi:hypothetical protein